MGKGRVYTQHQTATTRQFTVRWGKGGGIPNAKLPPPDSLQWGREREGKGGVYPTPDCCHQTVYNEMGEGRGYTQRQTATTRQFTVRSGKGGEGRGIPNTRLLPPDSLPAVRWGKGGGIPNAKQPPLDSLQWGGEREGVYPTPNCHHQTVYSEVGKGRVYTQRQTATTRQFTVRWGKGGGIPNAKLPPPDSLQWGREREGKGGVYPTPDCHHQTVYSEVGKGRGYTQRQTATTRQFTVRWGKGGGMPNTKLPPPDSLQWGGGREGKGGGIPNTKLPPPDSLQWGGGREGVYPTPNCHHQTLPHWVYKEVGEGRGYIQSSGAVWKSRWTSWAPVPNKPTVSVDVKRHFNNHQDEFTMRGGRGGERRGKGRGIYPTPHCHHQAVHNEMGSGVNDFNIVLSAGELVVGGGGGGGG